MKTDIIRKYIIIPIFIAFVIHCIYFYWTYEYQIGDSNWIVIKLIIAFLTQCLIGGFSIISFIGWLITGKSIFNYFQ